MRGEVLVLEQLQFISESVTSDGDIPLDNNLLFLEALAIPLGTRFSD